MNILRCKSDEGFLYSPISPDVVDISSDSDHAFFITSGNIGQLDEIFRIYPAGSNLMSAFMGSTKASLYPDTATTLERGETAGTPEAQLERDFMELIEGSRDNQIFSPNSFIDSEFEDGNLFPWTTNSAPEENVNNYGRSTA